MKQILKLYLVSYCLILLTVNIQTQEFTCPPSKIKPKDIVCTADYDPVCGKICEGKGDKSFCVWQTFPNRCSACIENIVSYTMGECDGDSSASRPASSDTYCSSIDLNQISCAGGPNPVCGYFDPQQVQCKKAPCARTYDNICKACRDDKVLFYTEGPCENYNRSSDPQCEFIIYDEQGNCFPPDSVCGLFDPAQIQCIQAPCGGDFSNMCEACSDSTVISIHHQSCQELRNNIPVSASQLIYPSTVSTSFQSPTQVLCSSIDFTLVKCGLTPACGTHPDGSRVNYINYCDACFSGSVSFINDTTC
jgi:hypothetical protein